MRGWIHRVFLLLAFSLIGYSVTFAASKTGIVLLHGKQGSPQRMQGLAAALSSAGYLVVTPEMCWSRNRIYDRPFPDCLKEIDQAIARLRKEGATSIVVAGQSIGGNAALAYAAQHGAELKGVIGLAPAHNPDKFGGRPAIANDLARAKSLANGDKASQRLSFTDINHGHEISVTATPVTYVSFFDPNGPAIIPANTRRITIPLLWVAGNNDPTQKGGPGYAFSKASNPKNKYAIVSSDHMGTPDASKKVVIDWLRTLD